MGRNTAEITRFGSVGALNTLLDYSLFSLLAGSGMAYMAAQCISYSAGVLNSYFLNRTWTFKQTEKASFAEFFRFMLTNGVTFLATSLVLWLFHEQGSLGVYSSKLGATVVGTMINFAGTKLLVFSEKEWKRGEHT
ncbi:GtrA family protein [Fictibacillus fluitans]|uniref:GtrA family protein n=1 Tax=Fictibacillus fluitans TaxID=3058422 RepID=A0ABT8HWJ1_9BACL|nr:GtrA family protein [Fictibacillus sp. NE201]MDN4524627.1 GtrA family protein [Fictibacillus sp. NE201]